MLTPCVRKCKVDNGKCTGCSRTLDEIKEWKNMSDETRMKLMKEIQARSSTHTCPSCSSRAYCAMEDGKSANLCWCFNVENKIALPPEGMCLCEKCLTTTSD